MRGSITSGLVGDVVFNDFIQDHFIPEGHGQVASGSASLADPVAWRQRSRCSKESRMRVMFLKHWVSTIVTPECLSSACVVNTKTLKGRFIAHKFSSGWAVCVVTSVEKKESVAGQFADKVY